MKLYDNAGEVELYAGGGMPTRFPGGSLVIGPQNKPEVAAALTDYHCAVRNLHIHEQRQHGEGEEEESALLMAVQVAENTLRRALIRDIGINDKIEVWATNPNTFHAGGAL